MYNVVLGFQVYSIGIQLGIYIYSSFFKFFFHVGYQRILRRVQVPCAIE